MPRVLIAEPDRALCEALVGCIRDAGWDAIPVENAVAIEPTRHAVLVLDVADAAGVRRVEALARAGSVVIALGAAEPRRLAIDALRAGAHEYLRKPFELRALERALAGAEHALRKPALRHELASEDASMHRLLRDATAAARSDATLQIVGEPGTGRRRVARWVHLASGRRDAPFVVLADAAERTSFEEAFGAAHGGTLLIDEPAALTSEKQAELAEALAHHAAPHGPRLVAISRAPLREDRRLRADLRLRLDVLAIALAPLRERPLDVVLLAREFAAKAALARGVEPPRFPPAALEALCALPLPGNAHELANLMERAVALFAGRDLDVAALLRGGTALPPSDDAAESLDLGRLERIAIERALARSKGNRTHAARALGISVRTLRNKIREYGAADTAEAAEAAL